MIDLSVIIPTYNRSGILAKTLSSLGSQTVPKTSFEVIIIDDGSSPKELKVLHELVKNQKLKVKLLLQKHKGPAAARNKGIRRAKGRIILIINDDTVPGSDLIKKHLQYHQKNKQDNYGLLGRVTWHNEIEVTPFMHWLENGGPYFSFNSIKGENAGWERLWTCNISFKRNFLLTNGLFDESFPDAAWEDVELGYRLSLAGLVLQYDRKALGYHYHPTTIASIKNKMKANGRNLILIRQKLPQRYWPPLARHPKLAIFLNKVSCISVLAGITEAFPEFFSNVSFRKLFDLVLLHYRIVGLSERSIDKL